MNKNYIKGRNFEYTIQKKLLNEGWTHVFRTPGSKSPADLVAHKQKTVLNTNVVLWGTHVLYVQCKSGKARLSKKGKQELLEFAQAVGAEAMYAYKPSRGKIMMEVVE